MTRRFAVFAMVAGLAWALSPGLSPLWPTTPAGSPLPARGGQAADARGQSSPGKLTLPLKAGSVRFAVIGDSGTGKKEQYEVAQQMAAYHQSFPFDFTIMLGDNLYGGDSPSDYRNKFEQPYQALIEDGVKFYASLGNHDNPNECFYKPFNMGGQHYDTFKKGNVRFIALDSNYMNEQQMNWLTQQLSSADSPWKICFFHHPLYSDGKFHGPDLDLRKRIEPILEKYGVNVVFSGHEHVYERIVPQNGIYYFVEGSSGELRYHNLRPSPEMAAGFDTDRAFMLVEIAGDNLYFQTISRTGQTVDSGVLARQTTKSAATRPINHGNPSASRPVKAGVSNRPLPAGATARTQDGELVAGLDRPGLLEVMGKSVAGVDDGGRRPCAEHLSYTRPGAGASAPRSRS